jgi:capsule polysaccharide export protein KpsE/RkpR
MANGTVDSVYRPPPACACNCRKNFSLFLIIFIICHYFQFYASKLSNIHQIFDIKSRTSLMYDGSVGICSVHSDICESDKEIFSKGKPKNDKRMLDKRVDGRDQKKTIYGSFYIKH